MGGRGASSISPISHKRGGLNAEFEKGLGLRVPSTSKEALGAKGKPIGMVEAYEKANPYYNPEYQAYSFNCQRCIVAYEMRRRGYDVTAQATYLGDKRGVVAHTNNETGQKYVHWMGAFRHARPVNVGARSSEAVVSNIDKKMKSYGEGSRAVVQVLWKRGNGHVFNIENVGGKIKAVDAQNGKTRSLSETIAKAKPGSVNLIRTDNLRPSERIREFVSPTGWR